MIIDTSVSALVCTRDEHSCRHRTFAFQFQGVDETKTKLCYNQIVYCRVSWKLLSHRVRR